MPIWKTTLGKQRDPIEKFVVKCIPKSTTEITPVDRASNSGPFVCKSKFYRFEQSLVALYSPYL